MVTLVPIEQTCNPGQSKNVETVIMSVMQVLLPYRAYQFKFQTPENIIIIFVVARKFVLVGGGREQGVSAAAAAATATALFDCFASHASANLFNESVDSISTHTHTKKRAIQLENS